MRLVDRLNGAAECARIYYPDATDDELRALAREMVAEWADQDVSNENDHGRRPRLGEESGW